MDSEVADSVERDPVIDVALDIAPSWHAAEAGVELPDYLVRYYHWAYLRPSAVWFFDHQPVISAILFGNYRRILETTLRLMQPASAGRTLQIAVAYGELASTLARRIDDLHLIDVAPIQLEATSRKLEAAGLDARLALMNAEYLTFEDDSFDTTAMFMLLHELPPDARRRSLSEALRVLRAGGRLVIADYGELRRRHPFHRLAPLRWLLTKADPFLDGFWREDLEQLLAECASAAGKRLRLEHKVEVFGGFYRVLSYRLD